MIMNYQAFKMCLVYYVIDSAITAKRFRGVVGYHIRLTRGRSPVRTRTKTNSFLTEKSILIYLIGDFWLMFVME